MANILEKKTINGSLVIENMAGIESTANIKSENSMTINTINKGVISHFLFFLTKNLLPTYLGKTLKYFAKNFTTG